MKKSVLMFVLIISVFSFKGTTTHAASGEASKYFDLDSYFAPYFVLNGTGEFFKIIVHDTSGSVNTVYSVPSSTPSSLPTGLLQAGTVDYIEVRYLTSKPPTNLSLTFYDNGGNKVVKTVTNSSDVDPSLPPVLNPTLDVAIIPEKIGVGKEFTADISLKNVNNIYAEDFEVKYDAEHLQYLGFEGSVKKFV